MSPISATPWFGPPTAPPFTRDDDYTVVDLASKLKAAMFVASSAIAGPGNVVSVVVLSQTPKARTGLPKPKIATAH